MSTTLPLFWHLSSASKKERIDASVKLIGALEHFQAQFVPKESPETSDDEEQEAGSAKADHLDALNAQDVSYSVRRLVRGLASPRESSRLGFAVALTELLSRLDTVTCSQIVALILDSSKTQGSMSGQEERDVLFARLFGLTSVIQSGLLLRDTPLPTSASSSTLASSLTGYQELLTELLALGEKKSWLRESAWWSIGLGLDALGASQSSWKEDAIGFTVNALFIESRTWTPEKVALILKLQHLSPTRDWRKLLSPTFKHPDLLSSGNLISLAKILKESNMDDDEESDLPRFGAWKPQVHFVWDMLLDEVLPDASSHRTTKGSFPEFFRIVVDESLFSSTSSPERKYWGFQIFQKALPRVSATDMPMLFTKNFMRSWINHLSNSDRYLHKAARQVVTDIQAVVKKNPTIGFTLILQLTGVHGSHQFDKLTKTKTVETILTSMDNEGIQNYIDYLLKQVDDKEGTEAADIQALNARRAWIIDQLAALVRHGAIPKSDEWIQSILDWFVVHGLFIVSKKSEKSTFRSLRSIPNPAFSDELRSACRDRLLSCLAELTGQSTVIKDDNKTTKMPAVASDGELWISRVLSTIEKLEQDTKHVKPLVEADEEDQRLRSNARQVVERLKKVSDDQREAAMGAELLLSATLLHQYCMNEEMDSDTLESCIDGASRMFPAEHKKSKKARKSMGAEDEKAQHEVPEPVDVLVDSLIGFLEKATAYMRAVANQVFSLLSGSVKESTIDLILTQLERRDPAELAADEDEDNEEDEGSDENEEEDEDEGESSNDDDGDEEEDDMDEAEAQEVRRKIEEALRVNGVEAATGDSDEESEDLMDDDQMLAIDEQLSAAFRARAGEKKLGKDVDAQREATHFKNRVLDLLETFIKKQPKNPLVLRLILPLVELVVSTGPDEKHLADKATGLLRTRLGKSKEVLSIVDTDEATVVLEELHTRARKSDNLATLSQCSIYLSRSLLHAGFTETVVRVYRESLDDFVTRKASKLNSNFFQDFIRRHPEAGWALRNDLIEVSGKAVNVYRQCQAFQILHTLISQVPASGDHRADILKFIPTLRRSLHDVISNACGDTPTLTPAQMKELLKLGLTAVRQTKRFASSPEEVFSSWDPSTWNVLAGKLAASDRFKSSTGLQTMCKQMAQLASETAQADIKAKASSEKSKSNNATVTAKRKVNTLEDVEDTVKVSKKIKRQKVTKVKT
ncbi:hypothetical protein SCP_0410150 [Sparassis crispa]|uniref:DNA polymerase V n=1 Tax=Sparassis crispa TaxID=139825 RepID=A0A401GKE5_9APHY|nr:hypothetical protein SCP_0410150 [Sparassis crispa]GBE82630.1 hypothetical protein SCP_0410150 [Sparassis crispa]